MPVVGGQEADQDELSSWTHLVKSWDNLHIAFNKLTQDQRHLVAELTNFCRIYQRFVDTETPIRVKTLTASQLAACRDETLLTELQLTLPDIIDALNKIKPFPFTHSNVKQIGELIEQISRLIAHPPDDRKKYLNDYVEENNNRFDFDKANRRERTFNIMTTLGKCLSFLTHLDYLSGGRDVPRDFARNLLDLAIAEAKADAIDQPPTPPQLSYDDIDEQDISEDQKDALRRQRLANHQQDLAAYYEDQRQWQEALEKIDEEYKAAQRSPYQDYLYEDTFVNWIELVVKQLCFYVIEHSTMTITHDRHPVVNKLMEEATRLLSQRDLSTIERMHSMATFILQSDIRKHDLFSLLIKPLNQVPGLQNVPLHLVPTKSCLTRLANFKASEDYINLNKLYNLSERQSLAVAACYVQNPNFKPPSPIPATMSFHSQQVRSPNSNLHPPFEPLSHVPLTKQQIDARFQKIPQNFIYEYNKKIACNVLWKFVNWFKSFFNGNKIRAQLESDICRQYPIRFHKRGIEVVDDLESPRGAKSPRL